MYVREWVVGTAMHAIVGDTARVENRHFFFFWPFKAMVEEYKVVKWLEEKQFTARPGSDRVGWSPGAQLPADITSCRPYCCERSFSPPTYGESSRVLNFFKWSEFFF